jgi:hypothetical protein
MRSFLALGAALASLALPLSALAQAAPTPAPTAQPTPVSPLIVQERANPAVLKKQARGFVDSYAAPTKKLGKIARWYDPPCVLVTGLAPEQAAQFKTGVETVARTVGAPVGPPGCSPNIQIAFTNDPQTFVNVVAARNTEVLGYGGDKTVTRPIQAWYDTTSLGQPPAPGRELTTQGAVLRPQGYLDFDSKTERFKDRLGATPTPHGFAEGRRCIDSSSPSCPHSGFLNVLIVVDAAHMGDVGVDLTSDYLAMIALSQPLSLDGCLVLPSVLDLYANADACPGRDAPAGLTTADKAYLTSLYAADLTVDKSGEQSDIAGRMVKILGAPKPAAH